MGEAGFKPNPALWGGGGKYWDIFGKNTTWSLLIYKFDSTFVQ